MKFADSYPVIITDKLIECRDFYARWFGFEVVFEATWFIYLHNEEAAGTSIALMHPDHPSTPPTPGSFIGDGMFLTFQVENAEDEYNRVTVDGLEPDLALTEEPWGQKRFGVVDPAGVWVDVVEQTAPADGWWDQYITA